MTTRLVVLLTLLAAVSIVAVGHFTRGAGRPAAQTAEAAAPAAPPEPAVVDFGSATSAPEVRALLENAYRLPADRRMVAAVADVRRVLGGRNDAATAAWQPDRWRVTCGTDDAGTWPEAPSFGEALELLEGFARTELARAPLADGTPDPRAALALSDHSPDAALAFLQVPLRGGASRALLAQALVAATQLALPLGGDRSGFADDVAARALALLAIARAAGDGPHEREACALAWAMGYRAEARSLAGRLRAGDPLRLLARREDEKLVAAARDSSSSSETRLAALLSLARRSRIADWHELATRWFPEKSLHVGQALATGLLFARFDVQRALPEVLCATALRGLERAPATSRTSAFDVAGFEFAMREIDARDAPAAIRGLVPAESRARFYSGIVLGTHFSTRTLSSEAAVRDLADRAGAAASGRLAALAGWQQHLAQSKSGDEPPRAALRADLEEPSLSAEMARMTYDVLVGGALPGGPATRDAVRALGRRLDSRPRHQLVYAWEVQDGLLWPELTERLLASATAHTGDDDPRVLAVLHFLRRDFAALEALLSRDTMEPRDALYALERWVGADSSAADRLEPRFAALCARAPGDFALADALADLREARGRFASAEQALRAWQAAPSPDADALDGTVAATSIARLRRKQGDLAGAMAAIGDHDRGMQYNAMAEKARLLVLDGRLGEALEVARRARERYPDSPRALGLAAELQWRAGDPAAAARAVAEFDPTGDDWREGFVDPFLDVFARRPREAHEALAAMRGVVPGMPRRCWTLGGVAARSEPALAIELMQESPVSGGIELTMQLGQTYALHRRERGAEAAREWLANRRLAPALVGFLQMELASRGELAGTWQCSQRPGGILDEFGWLTRASAWRLAGAPAGAERDSLLAVARAGGGKYYLDVLRYLVGELPEADVLAIATDRHRRAEVWYYCAVRARSEGRWRDAARWYQLVLETAAMRDGEWIWSQRALVEWGAAWCVPERLPGAVSGLVAAR